MAFARKIMSLPDAGGCNPHASPPSAGSARPPMIIYHTWTMLQGRRDEQECAGYSSINWIPCFPDIESASEVDNNSASSARRLQQGHAHFGNVQTLCFKSVHLAQQCSDLASDSCSLLNSSSILQHTWYFSGFKSAANSPLLSVN